MTNSVKNNYGHHVLAAAKLSPALAQQPGGYRSGKSFAFVARDRAKHLALDWKFWECVGQSPDRQTAANGPLGSFPPGGPLCLVAHGKRRANRVLLCKPEVLTKAQVARCRRAKGVDDQACVRLTASTTTYPHLSGDVLARYLQIAAAGCFDRLADAAAGVMHCARE